MIGSGAREMLLLNLSRATLLKLNTFGCKHQKYHTVVFTVLVIISQPYNSI